MTSPDCIIPGIKDIRQSRKDVGKGREHGKRVKGGKQAVEMEEQLEGSCKMGVGDSARNVPKGITDR